MQESKGKKMFQPKLCCHFWFKAMTWVAAGEHRRRDRDKREEIALKAHLCTPGRHCPIRPTGGAAKRQKLAQSTYRGPPWF